jgi:hypothetical protein
MDQVTDSVRVRGGKTTAIFTSLGVIRAYKALLQADRQYVNTTEYAGGAKAISYVNAQGDVPVVGDVMAPTGQIHFVNEKDLKVYRVKDWNWLDRPGGMWRMKRDTSGDYDAYIATMHQYSQLGVHRRNSHARLEDITEA